jgi:hypothetical protein
MTGLLNVWAVAHPKCESVSRGLGARVHKKANHQNAQQEFFKPDARALNFVRHKLGMRVRVGIF